MNAEEVMEDQTRSKEHSFWVACDDNTLFVTIFPADSQPFKRGSTWWAREAKYPGNWPPILQVDVFVKLFGWEPKHGECVRVVVSTARM